MKSYSIFLHVNPTEIRFVGDTWEEGGFAVNDSGDPVRDCRGNTVAKFAVTEIDRRDADLLLTCYCGGGALESGQMFAEWMAGDCGLGNQVIAEVCAELGVKFSLEKLAEFREIMAIRSPWKRLAEFAKKND